MGQSSVIISYKTPRASSKIMLPGSKSIANRALIIDALCNGKAMIKNLSAADDTRILREALASGKPAIDVGHAGTAFRFLTAYFAFIPGERVLTGSARMKKRPVAPLVSALRNLGGKIEYPEENGYPPLKIFGGALNGGEVTIETGTSSQFLSALMLIAPNLPGGLIIRLQGRRVSTPYVEMTARVMQAFGAEVSLASNSIFVPAKSYQPISYTVESDWSSAAYWYQLAHVSGVDGLMLRGLHRSGLQGDEQLVDLYRNLGIDSMEQDGGILLRQTGNHVLPEKPIDFSKTPDLVPSYLAGMAARNTPVKIVGVEHLRIKESNRLEVLADVLHKLGAELRLETDSIELLRGITGQEPFPVFETYNDHRMAMAFAMLSPFYGKVQINHPEVVNKSYPEFWTELRKVGFTVVG